MPKLISKTQNKVLLADLRLADSMWTRMKGLLGTNQLTSEQGLWILKCNSIHTFFMRFTIDCIFIDHQMTIKSLKRQVRPGGLVLPQWGASSVIEIRGGQVDIWGLKIGDQLNVGD